MSILNNIEYLGQVTLSKNVLPIHDSRQADENSLFFAIPGVLADGHDYAKQALAQGAQGIVVERDLGLPKQIMVKDAHRAYSLACGNYFDNPAKKLTLLGVTGTNGKTTVTYLAKQILEAAGKKVGMIGTIQNIIGDMSLPARHTTPDPFQLHSLFSRMVEAGCQYVVMEVSSHALTQKRVEGCHFAVAAFTNLSQDHLDYHGTMENYFAAKKELFAMADRQVLNQDDEHGRRLLAEYPSSITFSVEEETASLFAHTIRFTQRGSHFIVKYQGEEKEISFIQPGFFSVSNALTAAGLCLAVGISFQDAMEGLSLSTGVAGRFEILPASCPFTIVRDFAHSPDGLEQLLRTVKQFDTGRIITLFGCAGVRDRTKRPIMAAAVARYSDFCVLTSDNPRTEDPQQIIDDALPGLDAFPEVGHVEFIDRLEAIRWALTFCQADDLLLLAGKGHEDYQVLDWGTAYFDEREIVLRLMGEAK